MSSRGQEVLHPAPFNGPILDAIGRLLAPRLVRGARVLDPFAGVGTLGLLGARHGWRVVGNEMERPWAAACGQRGCFGIQGDAVRLPFAGDAFQAAATSPSYGSRVNDVNVSRTVGTATETRADRVRRTYDTYLRRMGATLRPGNSGAGMHFGRKNGRYERLHEAAYREVFRVLVPGGWFVVNVKDFLETRKGVRVRQELVGWTCEALRRVGFDGPVEAVQVPLKGDQNTNRARARGDQVVDEEVVVLYRKPA